MVPYTEEELNRINKRRKIINKEVSSSTYAAQFLAVFFTIIILLYLFISLGNDNEGKKKTEKYEYASKKRKAKGGLGLLIVGIVIAYIFIFSIIKKVYIGTSGITDDDLNFHFKINSEIINKFLETKGNFKHSRTAFAVNKNDLYLARNKNQKPSNYQITGEDLISGDYKNHPVMFSEVLIKKEERSFNVFSLRWETEEVLLFDGVFLKIVFEKPFLENMAFAIGKTKYLDITYPKLFVLNLGNHRINVMCHNEIVAKDLGELVLSGPLIKLFDKFGTNIKVVFLNNILYIVHTELDDKFSINNSGDITQSQITKVHRDIELYFDILDMLELESNLWDTMTTGV